MKRGVAALAGVALLVAGCGGAKALDTRTVVATLREAGFADLHVISNKALSQKVAREFGRPTLAQNPIDADFIYTGRLGNPVVMPLTVARLHSAAIARGRFANDQPLLRGKVAAIDRAALPRRFDPRRLTDIRICNLVLTSYNAANDRALTMRVERAISALRKKC